MLEILSNNYFCSSVLANTLESASEHLLGLSAHARRVSMVKCARVLIRVATSHVLMRGAVRRLTTLVTCVNARRTILAVLTVSTMTTVVTLDSGSACMDQHAR